MKITLYKAFPDPYRQSMAVYADRLAEALQGCLVSGETAVSFVPKRVCLRPNLARYWSQYVDYQWQAQFEQGDINHITDHSYSHLAYSLKRGRTIVTFHDAISLKYGAWRWILHYNLGGLRKASWVICDSEKGREDLVRLAGYPRRNTTVIYPGIKDAFFREPKGNPYKELGIPEGEYFLHVGHTQSYKNIPALFHVLSVLKRRGKDVRLLKVGTEFTSEQEALAESLNVRDRIIHLGLLAPEKLISAYRAAGVLLFPSLDEGFGFPVLEAMAAGIPVIASDQGALPELVQKAGILADPQDYEMMAQYVTELLERSNLRKDLTDRGKERARMFTWKRAALQTMEVYRRVFRHS